MPRYAAVGTQRPGAADKVAAEAAQVPAVVFLALLVASLQPSAAEAVGRSVDCSDFCSAVANFGWDKQRQLFDFLTTHGLPVINRLSGVGGKPAAGADAGAAANAGASA